MESSTTQSRRREEEQLKIRPWRDDESRKQRYTGSSVCHSCHFSRVLTPSRAFPLVWSHVRCKKTKFDWAYHSISLTFPHLQLSHTHTLQSSKQHFFCADKACIRLNQAEWTFSFRPQWWTHVMGFSCSFYHSVVDVLSHKAFRRPQTCARSAKEHRNCLNIFHPGT